KYTYPNGKTQTIAFLVPNLPYHDAKEVNPETEEIFRKARTSVKAISDLAGYEFFPDAPDRGDSKLVIIVPDDHDKLKPSEFNAAEQLWRASQLAKGNG